MITIIPYDDRYRDDMIFMVLEAKNALGRVPTLNEDLLDIPGNYLARGELFWLAMDENERVVGCVGYHNLECPDEAKLQRLYVKCSRKRQGIGSQLLRHVEAHLRAHGTRIVRVHMGGPEYYESYHFYPKHGYVETAPRWMEKRLV